MSGSFDPGFAGAPDIERVEVTAGGVAGLLVRVEGRWATAGAAAQVEAVLLVRGDRRQFRFPALPGPAAEDGAWRATFSVPAELRPALDRELVLELGSLAVRLPAPGPSAPSVEPLGRVGTLIDRGVLAERRARRAEVGEERQARRAAEAEARVAELSVKVARLEADLDELRRAPVEAAGVVAELRRELTVARQRAHSEEQVRLEEVAAARAAATEARGRLAELEAQMASLRTDLRAARWQAAGAARPRPRLGRAAVLAREGALATASRCGPAPRGAIAAAPQPAPLRSAAAALAAEQAMAALPRPRRAPPNDGLEGVGVGGGGCASPEPLRAPAAPDPRAPAPPSTGGDRLSPELFRQTSITPAEPAPSRPSFAPPRAQAAPPSQPPFEGPDRLEAARRRLRTTATQLPQPTGPPDPSRLPKALRRLGRRDPAAAGRLVAALLPAHDLACELVLTDVGTIGNGPTRIETDAAGLGRLVLGSPPRRLLARRAVRIDGRRRSAAVRPLRRLAKTPLPWERLAAAGVTLDANLAYRWIALAVDPKWTRGERFTIAHVRQEDPDRPWFVRADDGRPLTVTAAEPRDRPAAEVHCPDAGLAAFLAQAVDHPARVTGDAGAVALLLAWANGRRA